MRLYIPSLLIPSNSYKKALTMKNISWDNLEALGSHSHIRVVWIPKVVMCICHCVHVSVCKIMCKSHTFLLFPVYAEGVCYAKKDYNLAKHPEIDVPNLQVIKLMQSFKSKEYVRETFAWMHYYWYLTNDGIEFLRTYLNLPSEIVPNTLKRAARPVPAGGRPGGPPGDRPR